MELDCTNCRFSRPSISDIPEESLILKCHRYPPTLLVDGDGLLQSFPSADEWCGEWKMT